MKTRKARMKMSDFMAVSWRKAKWSLATSLFILGAASVDAQTCKTVVAGSDFSPITVGDDYWSHDFTGTKQVGMSGNSFSTAATYSGDGNQYTGKKADEFVYCLTDDPLKLDIDSTHFPSAKDLGITAGCMVVKYYGVEAATQLLAYNIPGLVPGSEYKVTLKMASLLDTKAWNKCIGEWGQSTFMFVESPNSYGQSASETSENYVFSGAQLAQKFQTLTLVGKVPASGKIVPTLITGYNGNEDCQVLVITDVEVQGCFNPHITSSMGQEVCKGEQTVLLLDKKYPAKKYEWQKKSGGSWTTVGTNESYMVEMQNDETYRCVVDGQISNELEVKAIMCCEVNGKPASRKTILWEDFGHFTTPRTYVDRDGNVSTIPTKNANMRTDVKFDIPENEFDPTGYINDGYYGVVVPSENGYYDANGQPMTWMAGVAKDHTNAMTGVSDGAVLFINVNYNYHGKVFEATFPNICTGKEVYYETYIANMSGLDNSPLVTLELVDENGTVLNPQDNNIEATGGAGWIPIRGSVMLDGTGTKTITMRVIADCGTKCNDYSFWDKGNDLAIDDIIFRVCSPPSISVYSDLSLFTQDTTICADAEINLQAPVSQLLTNFYGGNQQYLYQVSVDMGKSWKNIGSIRSTNSLVINTSDYPDVKEMQFRVVVATEAQLDELLKDPNKVDMDDYCRSYALTDPYVVTRASNLDMGAAFQGSACIGEELELKGVTLEEIVAWEWADESGTILVEQTSDAAKRNYTIKKSDKEEVYYFIGYTADGCKGKRKYVITPNPTATFKVDVDEQCGKTLVTVSDVNPSSASIQWTLAGVARDETASIEFLPGEKGLLSGKITGVPNYCDSEVFEQEISVKEIPSEELPEMLPFCEGDKNVQLPTSEKYTVKWTPNETNLSSLEGKLTPYNYTYTVTNSDGCESEPAEYEFTVKPAAKVTLAVEYDCDLSTVTATPTPSGATVTWSTGAKADKLEVDNVALTAGTYTAVASAEGYCDSEEASMEVKFYPTPADLKGTSPEYLKADG
ncbi:MAG: hypothetical protein J6Y37_01705, partial [Paludibacteraceae bacterium]|nr:hypothetical protein [Paludibacteraceae bacterium]